MRPPHSLEFPCCFQGTPSHHVPGGGGLVQVRDQGDETSSPLFKRCVMRRRTGTSALSALPVRLVAGKIYLSTNRKSHFLSLFFSQPCTMIKTFFHSPGSQLKILMSAWTLVNLFHSKFPKNALNLRVSNACSCRKTWHGCLSSSLLKKLQITPP